MKKIIHAAVLGFSAIVFAASASATSYHHDYDKSYKSGGDYGQHMVKCKLPRCKIVKHCRFGHCSIHKICKGGGYGGYSVQWIGSKACYRMGGRVVGQHY